MTQAEENLRKVNSALIDRAVPVVEYARRQEFFYAMCAYRDAVLPCLGEWADQFLPMFSEINGDSPFTDESAVAGLFASLQNAQEAEDYVLLADLLEEGLFSCITECQKRLVLNQPVSVDEKMLFKNLSAAEKKVPGITKLLFSFDILGAFSAQGTLSDAAYTKMESRAKLAFKKGYAVEYTAQGNYTVMAPVATGRKIYLHTNNLPAREGFTLAAEWTGSESRNAQDSYLFYGLGFGYPYMSLLAMEDTAQVTVVEADVYALTLAFLFSPLYLLFENERFGLELDITNRKFFDLLAKQQGNAYVCHPMQKTVRNSAYRTRLDEFFMRESSYRTQKKKLDGNFKQNSRVPAESVWALTDAFAGKDCYIVAAGPSLDKNMQELKQPEKNDTAVILSCGTVAKKLTAAGIQPDFVIVTDVGIGVYRQLTGWEADVPLLFLSTANARAVCEYAGKKYRIYQEGYPPAQEAAIKEGVSCVETGGSVVTTAMALAVHLACRRIIFVGLDLAYTGGKDHAADTKANQIGDAQAKEMVTGTDGTVIKTAANLNIYRRWLEDEVKQMRDRGDNRPVIDATEGGAKKAGMEEMTLKQAIEEGKELPLCGSS